MKEVLFSILNKFMFFLIKFNFQVKISGSSNIKHANYTDLNDLISSHFDEINEPMHPCKDSLGFALSIIDNGESTIIIETGSSAWGTNSSVLFDRFISYKNSKYESNSCFYTCDLRLNPLINLHSKVSANTFLICNDSVKWIENLSKSLDISKFNFLIYLDSYDLDYKNPIPSGKHGFSEFISAIPFLKKGTVLIIDDSPVDIDSCPDYAKKDSELFFKKYGFFPGKGMFVDPVIANIPNVKKIFHKYQIIYIVE